MQLPRLSVRLVEEGRKLSIYVEADAFLYRSTCSHHGGSFPGLFSGSSKLACIYNLYLTGYHPPWKTALFVLVPWFGILPGWSVWSSPPWWLLVDKSFIHASCRRNNPWFYVEILTSPSDEKQKVLALEKFLLLFAIKWSKQHVATSHQWLMAQFWMFLVGAL